MKKILHFLFSLFLFALISGNISDLTAQTRNPVVEFCTGTWCQWCPCGDFTLENLLDDYPNLIPLAYHGPVGSDPYANFPGNQIISLLSMSGYPTAVVDRATGAPGDYTTWTSKVTSRINVPATVSIDMDKSFDETTGQLEATIYMTPLQDLTGNYSYNIVLTEDSLIYDQVNNGQCVSGGAGWVHYWVVRAMINGASGETLNSSSPWTTGDMITKTVSYNVSSAFNPDKCNLIVFVYKQNSPLYSAEIQQGEQWTLISPDYVASAASLSPDVIADHNTPANFDVVIRNRGLMTDKYDISADFTGPAEWVVQFTTINGTFYLGETDSVEVVPGDSTMVTVTVNPNGTDGAGISKLNFASRYSPGNHGSVTMRNVTSTGVYALVVDAGDGYSAYIDSSMQDVFTESYGMISRTALQQPGVDLSHFHLMTWSQGTTLPAFQQEEVDALKSYLDGGGNLFINGQDIGSDIFEPTGQSQFAQDFYHNYLHAAYMANSSSFYLIEGVPGDMIGDGIQFVPGFIYDKSLEIISRYDSYADSIFTYSTGPNVAGIRSDNNTSRVVYLGFGIEQIDSRSIRDTIFDRSVQWLTENVIPVELNSFSGKVNANDVYLTWNSSTETNNLGFEIQRRTTGDFNTVGFVKGKGTSTQSHTYSFTDNDLPPGSYSYRLKQVDFDGSVSYSKIIDLTISNPVIFDLAQNHPNPFNPSTIINYSIPSEAFTTLKIYDVLGNEVATLVNSEKPAGNYEVEFNATGLSSGIYFYKLQSSGSVLVRKMMIIK